jgi:hypothetical protein
MLIATVLPSSDRHNDAMMPISTVLPSSDRHNDALSLNPNQSIFTWTPSGCQIFSCLLQHCRLLDRLHHSQVHTATSPITRSSSSPHLPDRCRCRRVHVADSPSARPLPTHRSTAKPSSPAPPNEVFFSAHPPLLSGLRWCLPDHLHRRLVHVAASLTTCLHRCQFATIRSTHWRFAAAIWQTLSLPPGPFCCVWMFAYVIILRS